MNERIRELEMQVAESFDPLVYMPQREYAKEFNKRFAELIVKECLTVINQPNGVGDDDVIKISRDVKKHFGVE